MKMYLILMLIILSFTSCSEEKEKLDIGFVAGLSGKYSSLGTNIRDGFILAFDEIDNTINDTEINIIQKDDKQDKDEAKKIINDFINKEIKLIIGNSTSSMTKVSIPIINEKKDYLLFSATASSREFSKKNDNFIRIQVEPSIKRYKKLNNYLQKDKHKNIYFIYDSKNSAYTNDYKGFFQDTFVSNGGNRFVGSYDINSKYEDIVEDMETKKFDLILLVANSIDSANIIQYLRVKEIETKVLISGWAKTSTFITNGGKSVEDVIVSSGYDYNSNEKSFKKFVNKFQDKYNRNPSIFSAQGYELGQILIENLNESLDLSSLKKRILEKKKYDGLQGDITFDKYGDVFREYFIMKVKNQDFVRLNN